MSSVLDVRTHDEIKLTASLHLPGMRSKKCFWFNSTVRLKLEQYQLLTGCRVVLLQGESFKYLIHRDFFEKSDAKNLQDFSETAVDVHFLF